MGIARRSLALAAAAALSGCGAVLPARDGGLGLTLDTEPREGQIELAPGGPRPMGPVVEVARGEVGGDGFSIVAYRSGDGVCTQLTRAAGGSAQCGSLPGAGPLAAEFGPFGAVGTGGGEGMPVAVLGVVETGVAAVWIESLAGRRAEARLIDLEPADIDAQLFLAFLPEGDGLGSVVALDVAGGEVGRGELMAPPGGPPGAVPTPAGP